MKNTTTSEVIKKIYSKKKIKRFIELCLGALLVALSFNIFCLPNNLVSGGISGLSIITESLFNLTPSVVILVIDMLLVVLSYFLLGIKETKKNLVCAIIFPLMVSILEPITNKINIEFSSYLFTCIVACVTYSIPLGIIYKVGYSTGGGDIINQIICKYAKTSVGQAGNYINIIIIFTATFVFGIPKSIYAIFTLIISNTIIDFIILTTFL